MGNFINSIIKWEMGDNYISKAKFTEFAHLCDIFLKKLSQTIDKLENK